jgi:hypothetical protein
VCQQRLPWWHMSVQSVGITSIRIRVAGYAPHHYIFHPNRLSNMLSLGREYSHTCFCLSGMTEGVVRAQAEGAFQMNATTFLCPLSDNASFLSSKRMPYTERCQQRYQPEITDTTHIAVVKWMLNDLNCIAFWYTIRYTPFLSFVL